MLASMTVRKSALFLTMKGTLKSLTFLAVVSPSTVAIAG